MRSVSFTRQLPMLRSVLVPSAKSAAHRRGHRGVGNVIEIGVERLQPAAPRASSPGVRLDPVLAHRDPRAHALEHFGEAHVALDARASDAFHPHRTAAAEAADRARGEKIRSRGRVAFDEDFARAAITARCRACSKRAQSRRSTSTPKRAQRVQRDLDVRLGDELAFDLDRAPRCRRAAAPSGAPVTNWLETLPRTLHRRGQIEICPRRYAAADSRACPR